MCKKIELENLELHSGTFPLYIESNLLPKTSDTSLTSNQNIPFQISAISKEVIYHETRPRQWYPCSFPNCGDIATKRIENLPKHVSNLACEEHYIQFSNHIGRISSHKPAEKLTDLEKKAPKKRKRKVEHLDKKPSRRVLRPSESDNRTYITRGRKAEQQITSVFTPVECKEVDYKEITAPSIFTVLCDHACFLYDELLAQSRKSH